MVRVSRLRTVVAVWVHVFCVSSLFLKLTALATRCLFLVLFSVELHSLVSQSPPAPFLSPTSCLYRCGRNTAGCLNQVLDERDEDQTVQRCVFPAVFGDVDWSRRVCGDAWLVERGPVHCTVGTAKTLST